MHAARNKAFLCDHISVAHVHLPKSKQIQELKLLACQLLDLARLALQMVPLVW